MTGQKRRIGPKKGSEPLGHISRLHEKVANGKFGVRRTTHKGGAAAIAEAAAAVEDGE